METYIQIFIIITNHDPYISEQYLNIDSNKKQKLLKQVLKLKVNPEYESLVQPLTVEEYEDLKRSIHENGQFIPIVVNKNGFILDGSHRFKTCTQLAIKPKIMIKEFQNSLYEQIFVIDSNLKRRHLNDFQKGVLILRKKPIYEKIAKLNMSKGGKCVKNLTPLIRVNGKLGKEVGLSHESIRKITIIQEKASMDDIQKLNLGQKTISKVYRKIQKELKREELMKRDPIMSLPKGVRIIHGDFTEKSNEIKENSVDLIFVDPLYRKDGLELYKKLGDLANRVLKVGGGMVVYAGQYYLDKVLNILLSSGLTYWWTFCIKHAEDHQLVYARSVFCEWKPLLWFVKGKKPNIIGKISDHIESQQPEKINEWEQSTIEAEYIMKHLTIEGQIVFDPMMGSGTSGKAAVELGRKFTGIEKDKQVFALAKKRIQNWRNCKDSQ